MSNNKKKVTFRRIRGRIVPIKVEQLQGGGLIGGGIGVAAASGMAAKGFEKYLNKEVDRAAYYSARANRVNRKLGKKIQLNLFDVKKIEYAENLKRAAKSSIKRALFAAKAHKFTAVGAYVGGAMAATGLYKIGKSFEDSNKKASHSFKATAPVLGVGAGLALYGRTSGLFTSKESLRYSVNIIKKAFKLK